MSKKQKSGKGGGGSAQRSAKKYRELHRKDRNVILNRIRELKRDRAILSDDLRKEFMDLEINKSLKGRFVLDFTCSKGLRLKGRGAYAVKLALANGLYNDEIKNLLINEAWDTLRLKLPQAKIAQQLNYRQKEGKSA